MDTVSVVIDSLPQIVSAAQDSVPMFAFEMLERIDGMYDRTIDSLLFIISIVGGIAGVFFPLVMAFFVRQDFKGEAEKLERLRKEAETRMQSAETVFTGRMEQNEKDSVTRHENVLNLTKTLFQDVEKAKQENENAKKTILAAKVASVNQMAFILMQNAKVSTKMFEQRLYMLCSFLNVIERKEEMYAAHTRVILGYVQNVPWLDDYDATKKGLKTREGAYVFQAFCELNELVEKPALLDHDDREKLNETLGKLEKILYGELDDKGRAMVRMGYFSIQFTMWENT